MIPDSILRASICKWHVAHRSQALLKRNAATHEFHREEWRFVIETRAIDRDEMGM
jgi:hypothetical protein